MSLVQVDISSNDVRIKEICGAFWEIKDDQKFAHTISELAQKFSVKSSDIQKIVSENCEAYSEDNICNHCKLAFVYSNRTDYQHKIKSVKFDAICSQCKAEEVEARRMEQLAKLEEQRQAIHSHYALSPNIELDAKELSFENAVYLISFIRANASENLLIYGPLTNSKESLAPNKQFGFDIAKQLYRAGYITVSPNSPIDAFAFKEDVPDTFFLDKVFWVLNFGEDAKKAQNTINELERVFRQEDWPNHWYGERISLWKKLALQECLTYLEVVMSEHNLAITPGEKTYLVFENVLEEYSVGQIYNLIWRAGRDAAAFYMRGGVSKPHAANTVVGSIQRQADKAKAEGWETKAYRRDRRCPESVVSQVLFNTAIKIGENGFTLPPIASSLTHPS